MLENVLESMLGLKWYIAIVLVSTLVICALFLRIEAKSTLKSRSMKLLGAFFDMTDMGAMALAAAWLRLLFVIYMLSFSEKLTGINAFCLGAFVVMEGVATKKLRVVFEQTLNTALIACSFLTLDILTGYMRDVETDWHIGLIAILLGVFILLYSVYFFVKDFAVYADCDWKKVRELGKKE